MNPSHKVAVLARLTDVVFFILLTSCTTQSESCCSIYVNILGPHHENLDYTVLSPESELWFRIDSKRRADIRLFEKWHPSS